MKIDHDARVWFVTILGHHWLVGYLLRPRQPPGKVDIRDNTICGDLCSFTWEAP